MPPGVLLAGEVLHLVGAEGRKGQVAFGNVLALNAPAAAVDGGLNVVGLAAPVGGPEPCPCLWDAAQHRQQIVLPALAPGVAGLLQPVLFLPDTGVTGPHGRPPCPSRRHGGTLCLGSAGGAQALAVGLAGELCQLGKGHFAGGGHQMPAGFAADRLLALVGPVGQLLAQLRRDDRVQAVQKGHVLAGGGNVVTADVQHQVELILHIVPLHGGHATFTGTCLPRSFSVST